MKLTLAQIQKQTNDFTKIHTFSEVQVGPELAKVLLQLNTNNRPRRNRKINEYAATMAEGKWQYNGDSIRISKTGRLLDGQHRLLAIELSGATIYTNVTVGLDDDVFQTIDQGLKRSASDTVSFMGIKNATQTANLVKWIVAYDINKDFGKTHKATVTNQDVATYLSMCNAPEAGHIEVSVSKSSNYYKRFKGITSAQAAFFYWLLGGINHNKAEEFLYLLTTGDGIGSNKYSSIWLLRRKLEKAHESATHTELQMRNAIIIKAWNLFIKNTEVKSLNWDDRQDFPVAIKK